MWQYIKVVIILLLQQVSRYATVRLNLICKLNELNTVQKLINYIYFLYYNIIIYIVLKRVGHGMVRLNLKDSD